MSRDPIQDYNREREERLKNVAPQRDQKPVSESDIWQGERYTAEAKRVRDAKVNDLHAFTRKKHGRAATAEEIAAYLNEGGAK